MKNKKPSDYDYVTTIIRNYIISELIDKKHDDPKCQDKVNALLAMTRSKIDNFCAAVYKQKDSISESVLFEYVDKYVNALCDEYEKVNLDKPSYKLKDYFYATFATHSLFRGEIYPTYQEGISDYQVYVLSIYKELAYKLGITDSLNLSHFFTKLLWDGYFSVSNNHTYRMKDRLITYLFSLEVFQGKGVCLNYASLLHDFLTICGKESYIVICEIDHNLLDRKDEDKADIDRNIDVTFGDKFKMILMTPIKLSRNDIGNHAITMIHGEKGLYYYDPTNIFVFNPDGSEKANAVNADGYINMKLNSNIFPPKSTFIKKHILDLVLRNKRYDTYTKDEVKNSLNRIIKLVDDNKELVNKAYFEARPYIEKICDEIEKNKDDYTLSGMVRKMYKDTKKYNDRNKD